MSDMLPIKRGMKQGALTTLLFNFALVYVIRRVQVNQDGFKNVFSVATLCCQIERENSVSVAK
jgi:hypothetical protein